MNSKPKIKEAIVVEGRYDKNTLSQIVDAVILETHGFGVFKDSQLLKLLRFYADSCGLIVFTDSDGAGFMIRNKLKSAIATDKLKHAYIPDVYGKERRKRKVSGEGKLGVEGMEREILLNTLRQAGASFIDSDDETSVLVSNGFLTSYDMYALGLKGGKNSAEKRRQLCAALGLPEHLSSDALLSAMNTLGLRLDSEIFDAYRSQNSD